MSRRPTNRTSEEEILRKETLEREYALYQRKQQDKLKGKAHKLFGKNNIMFDCVITERDNKSHFNDLSAYTYTITCKLCQHVTKRDQKSNLYLCSGCNREWIPETNTILKPSNQLRINRAKENGKLVLPCDEEEIENDAPKATPPCENPAVKEVTMKIVELGPGQTYYHAESGILFVGKA